MFVDGARGPEGGDPLDPATDVGPMVSVAAADELGRQLDETLTKGASLLCGGRAGERKTRSFPACVVDNIARRRPLHARRHSGSRGNRSSDSQHLRRLPRMANDTPYGTGCCPVDR